MSGLRVLIGCATSCVALDAFLRRGHDAWQCDIEPAEHETNRHIQDDIRDVIGWGWDLLILSNPPCTRLCNSGVRWLHEPPQSQTAQGHAGDLEAWAQCGTSPQVAVGPHRERSLTQIEIKEAHMREQLKDHIAAVVEGIRHLSVDDAADLIAEVGDQLACEEDVMAAAILDGLRWGYHAAVTVELGGGAMLRVILPGGIAMTHEWADEAAARPQIKAALDALHGARVIAQGVGDE